MSVLVLALLAVQQAAAPDPEEAILVTGSLEPVAIDAAPVSATIFERDAIEALALPLASDLLRLAPGVSVASTGPRGTQTQLRIRGAEANQTLLFVDGIELNDPAASNEARFELLAGDALSRIELVRGPQSALWGSEALGGVVAAETADPLADRGVSALAEYGSLDSYRVSAQAAQRLGNLGLAGGVGWIGSDGIDSFGSGGERDGFENRSAHAKAVFAPAPSTEIGLVGHWIEGESRFDGFDAFGRRADTLDATKNRLWALRGWGSSEWQGWTLRGDVSLLDSANRNRLGAQPLNSSFGERLALGAQVSRRLGSHRLTAAVDHEDEAFRTEGQAVFGAPDQDRSRRLTAFAGEWRGEWAPGFTTDIALRHDDFSAFGDATTFRASALFSPAPGWTLHAGYGEGIAQPEFYDLYGFFPDFFIGNPNLKPERSEGWELGLRWNGSQARIAVTGFSQQLKDEIVATFDTTTFLSSSANAEGKSRRRGIELEADYRFSALAELRLNYTYLEAEERQLAGGSGVLREVRRPKHSANAMLTGSSGPLSWGASLAYVGERQDSDFDFFPAPRVTLDDYLLGSLKLGYRVSQALEAYARVENAFDSDYQDVVGYDTAGRTVYAGLRLRLGD